MLQEHIDAGHDLGIAYAFSLPCLEAGYSAEEWKNALDTSRAKDLDMRTACLDSARNQVLDRDLPPRRLWDLHSNRVVPYWLVSCAANELVGQPMAISHSWMLPSLRNGILTSINGREWPVPIPKDTTLERVRNEMLNRIGPRYAWLDVLCLRQYGGAGRSDDLLKEEWKVDVPTIGRVYQHAYAIAHYYSGLGRPFRVGDMSDDRHWLNRAWTLQETGEHSFIAGVAPYSPLPTDGAVFSDPLVREFYERRSLTEPAMGTTSCALIACMRHRAATSELDKIAGLGYILPSASKALPAYIVGQSAKDAWELLIKSIHPTSRGDIFFQFPRPNNRTGTGYWFPSWKQVKACQDYPRSGLPSASHPLDYDEKAASFSYTGYLLLNCIVEGLSPITFVTGEAYRMGTIRIHICGKAHIMKAFAYHSETIPDDDYVLLGDDAHWAVGRLRAGKFVKLSILRLSSDVVCTHTFFFIHVAEPMSM
ncbi:hypothetical protein AURDEDRAFT_73484 [Auricularia subglabra TFB-10046 SS5]|uniref:Uncharacterized protein n=1 Tax=Auricularia subglabra (strain TFB-10046 / SS5) TaxID=717982 RepID=J0DAF1_AURST|nr:hypothetical protein AURDEDRAFT_73484 [Auricularia subglabra TFB-10046 SS5]